MPLNSDVDWFKQVMNNVRNSFKHLMSKMVQNGSTKDVKDFFCTHHLANRFADAGILQPAFFSVLLLRISDGPYLGDERGEPLSGPVSR